MLSEKQAGEPITHNSKSFNFNLLDFWQWAIKN